MTQPFLWPVRVYYEDTDNGGVVYYANYLKFMERARTEWLRNRGLQQDNLRAELGLIFAVRSVQAEYLKPARFNDFLLVSAEVVQSSRIGFQFVQQVRRMENDRMPWEQGELLNKGVVEVVCLQADTLKPKRMPTELFKEIAQ